MLVSFSLSCLCSEFLSHVGLISRFDSIPMSFICPLRTSSIIPSSLSATPCRLSIHSLFRTFVRSPSPSGSLPLGPPPGSPLLGPPPRVPTGSLHHPPPWVPPRHRCMRTLCKDRCYNTLCPQGEIRRTLKKDGS